jgi:hypothetical protein
MTTEQAQAIDQVFRLSEEKRIKRRSSEIADAFVRVYFQGKFGEDIKDWLKNHVASNGNGPHAREVRAIAAARHAAVKHLAREMAERGMIDMDTVTEWVNHG